MRTLLMDRYPDFHHFRQFEKSYQFPPESLLWKTTATKAVARLTGFPKPNKSGLWKWLLPPPGWHISPILSNSLLTLQGSCITAALKAKRRPARLQITTSALKALLTHKDVEEGCTQHPEGDVFKGSSTVSDLRWKEARVKCWLSHCTRSAPVLPPSLLCPKTYGNGF